MEILLVRHAESKANNRGMNQKREDKWSDTKLSNYGQITSNKLFLRLKNKKISRIYTSPLQRSFETANIIGQFQNARIIEDDRISERTKDEPNKGLSFRVNSFVKELKKLPLENTVIIVGHWSFNKRFLSTILKGKPFKRFAVFFAIQENTCINKIKYDGKDFDLVSVNDTKHLNFYDKIRLIREGFMRSLPRFLKEKGLD